MASACIRRGERDTGRTTDTEKDIHMKTERKIRVYAGRKQRNA